MKRNLDGILQKTTLVYILLPYVLFCLTWLKPAYGIVFGGIGLWILYSSWKKTTNENFISELIFLNKKSLFFAFFTLCVFMYFSGIGSYTFQNYDHLYRNAIFRDLVQKPWPVLYNIEGFGTHIFEGKTTVMTYYMGFFLPAAFVGKYLGFEIGKAALLLWSILGIFLVFLQICRYLHRFNLKTLGLFLGWGTLFFIGAFYKYPLKDILLEKSWLWAGMILYSDSNIGLFYYTFNQGIMAWLILMLIIQDMFPRQIVFWYCLCFFLSPFAFVGMAPFVLFMVFKDFSWAKFKTYFSPENIIGAGSVLGLTYLYLSSNEAGQFFQMLHHRPKIIILFLLLSWGIVAILLWPKYKKNGLYWLIIAVLLPLPFFQQGYGIDFPGRLSIPALSILMLLVGKTIIETKNLWIKRGLIAYLLVSGVVHLALEPVRSMYFTGIEYFARKGNFAEDFSKSENKILKAMGKEMQESLKNPTCIKDLGTLSNPKNEVIWNYMSDTEKSRFYKWVGKK
jgi:hypothetical protein